MQKRRVNGRSALLVSLAATVVGVAAEYLKGNPAASAQDVLAAIAPTLVAAVFGFFSNAWKATP